MGCLFPKPKIEAKNQANIKTKNINETNHNKETQDAGSPTKVPEVINYSSLPKVQAQAEYNDPLTFELCFDKGDIFYVINELNSDWWEAIREKDKQRGMIPSSYFKLYNEAEENSLENYDWFDGNMNRSAAERVLSLNGTPGTFIIRPSESRPKAYAVAIVDDNGQVKHYIIHYFNNLGYGMSPNLTFPSVNSLVEHYKLGLDPQMPRFVQSPQKGQGLTTDLGKDVWEVSRDSIRIIGNLGEGNFGKVFLASFKGKKNVAVKLLKDDEKYRDKFLEEAEIMKNVRHENLLLGVCTEKNSTMIIVEYMERGSLCSYLQQRGSKLQPSILVQMCVQICSGMKYLEFNNMVHRDLAARNILLSHDFNCKIADFGMAKLCEGSGLIGEEKEPLPVKWSSPEVLTERFFSIKSDVWSYGIVMWEIYSYCKMKPYPMLTNKESSEHIMSGSILEKPGDCRDDVYDVMKMCFTFNYKERPYFKDIHPLLENAFGKASAEESLYNQLE